MAVTKQTYTATATWTASQLANIFRSAFIDAGLMTEWFDSFLSGTIENRVLQVVNNPSKVYGTVYYWFMFTTSGVFINTALQWNEPSNVPTGTQYRDFFANNTNSTTNHNTLVSLAAATTCSITRYTSAINTDCTWFVVRNGTTNTCFLIPKGNYNAQSWIDQDDYAFNHMLRTSPLTPSASGSNVIRFSHIPCHLRGTFLGSASLRGATTASRYTQINIVAAYTGFGNISNDSSNVLSNGVETASNYSSPIWLPTAFVNTNASLAADHIPIINSISCSPYLPNLPADFGISAYYASNAMTVQDTLTVSAGVEEWEMISVANNSHNVDAAKLLFLARIVG